MKNLLLVWLLMVLASTATAGQVKVTLEKTFGELDQKLPVNPPVISSLDLSPDGAMLARSGKDGLVELWDVASASLIKKLPPVGGDVWQVRFGQNGKTLIAVLENDFGRADSAPSRGAVGEGQLFVAVWDAASGELRRSFGLRGDDVTSVDISPNGGLVAVFGEDFRLGRQATVWQTDTGRLLRGHTFKTETTPSLLFSPDNSTLVMGDQMAPTLVWNLKTGGFRRLGRGDLVMAFSPDGTTLASMSEDQNIRLRSVVSGRVVRAIESEAQGLWCIAFSPNGRLLASGSEDINPTLQLHDAATGKLLHILKGHQQGVADVVFSPDGTKLITADGRGTMRLWRLK